MDNTSLEQDQQNVLEQIKSIVEKHRVVLFMKGNQHVPMCGYSNFVVQVLNQLNVEFFDVDVLESDEMRRGIKQFVNWPTIPQLFIKGKFVGGCDIVKQLYNSGELVAMLKSEGII